jgi:hypothetical protein
MKNIFTESRIHQSSNGLQCSEKAYQFGSVASFSPAASSYAFMLFRSNRSPAALRGLIFVSRGLILTITCRAYRTEPQSSPAESKQAIFDHGFRAPLWPPTTHRSAIRSIVAQRWQSPFTEDHRSASAREKVCLRWPVR